jgi:hypothetical protein
VRYSSAGYKHLAAPEPKTGSLRSYAVSTVFIMATLVVVSSVTLQVTNTMRACKWMLNSIFSASSTGLSGFMDYHEPKSD